MRRLVGGDLIKVCKYLKGVHTEKRDRLFPDMPSDRDRGDGHTLKHRQFPTKSRKHFFTVKVSQHWQKLPKEALETRSLKIFRSHPDIVLGIWLWVALTEHGVGPDGLQKSLSASVSLWFCHTEYAFSRVFN